MARFVFAVAVGVALLAFASAGLLPSLSSSTGSGLEALLDPVLRLLLKLKYEVIKLLGDNLTGSKLKCLNSVVAGLVADVRTILTTTLDSTQDVVNGTLASLTNGGTVNIAGGGLLSQLLADLKERGRLMLLDCVA